MPGQPGRRAPKFAGYAPTTLAAGESLVCQLMPFLPCPPTDEDITGSLSDFLSEVERVEALTYFGMSLDILFTRTKGIPLRSSCLPGGPIASCPSVASAKQLNNLLQNGCATAPL